MLYTRLRSFDAVARAGSYVAAAEELGITQPALSIQVRALETAYGIQLFERRGRSIRLTKAGRELFALSRQFMRLEQQIEDQLTRSRTIAGERLKLAFDGPHVTMPIVARFRERYPDVDLTISLGNTRTVRKQLLEREVDVAVLPRVAGDIRIRAEPIRHHEAVVIVGKGHGWYGRKKIAVEELSGESMIARESGSNTQLAVDQGLAKVGVQPRIVVRLGSREALKEAVAANIGFGLVWASEAVGIDLHAIRLTGTEITSVDYLACLDESYRRVAVAAFFDVAREMVPARSPPPGGRLRRY